MLYGLYGCLIEGMSIFGNVFLFSHCGSEHKYFYIKSQVAVCTCLVEEMSVEREYPILRRIAVISKRSALGVQ